MVTPKQTFTLRMIAGLVDYHCAALSPFELELVDAVIDRWRANDELIHVTDAEWAVLEVAAQALADHKARSMRGAA